MRHPRCPKLGFICQVGSILVVAVSMGGCFGTVTGGSTEALKLETAMHQRMARGEAAKEKLLIAMRVAGAKLHEARDRVSRVQAMEVQ